MLISSHFLTFCALSFHYQAPQKPVRCPQVDFTKSPRGFMPYLSHCFTFGSDITAPSTIQKFPYICGTRTNGEILLSQLKSTQTPKMDVISISNDKNVNWTKFEPNPLENSRFQIFIAGTPDSRNTFFVFALTALRMVRFSIFQPILVEMVPIYQNRLRNPRLDHFEQSYGPPKLV